MKPEYLKAPYPWFGGKSAIAETIWKRFGSVRNFVEPFFGSGAVLLQRPRPFNGTETINDIDGFVSNFWRAIQWDAATVAAYADWPVNENDLHARHAWLVGQKDSLQTRLEGDPDYYDAKVAGWWVWGMCCWIGSGFCSGDGPWGVVEVDGMRQLVHLGDAGQGVNRQLVHLGDAGRGVNRQRVHLGDAGQEQNVSRKRPLITNDAVVVANNNGVLEWMQTLADRFARVRVCCGDWSRVCGPTPTVKQGLTAIFMDPPYSEEADRAKELYRKEDLDVAHAVREWCLEHSGDKRLRICLAGYESEGHEVLEEKGWDVVAWKSRGGYSSQAEEENHNPKRERLWFSPSCLRESSLFDSA